MALGAAAHMGRQDIAEYLIEQGARADIFAATMLGWADVVKAMLTTQPNAHKAPGPHGISLRAHAQPAALDTTCANLPLALLTTVWQCMWSYHNHR